MESKNYVNLSPMGIETDSMAIISEELSHLNIEEELSRIVKRIIHTTADFEYAHLFEANPQAYQAAIKALKSSCKIYVDTGMISAGVSKPALKKLNCSVDNFVHDQDVVTKAKELGITRSICGIDKAASKSEFKIYMIGNAPTALVRICELAKEGEINPDLVIGVPVGFVGAAESKQMLKESGLNYMIVRGRKGGSTVAVAILNAIMYDLIKRD
ncbi:MAG: precorrin-8X methylmutase [Marinifilaceae bacterium]|jgi:precorrin-8X/cobalt-precorrin-8 methylmutase|nr:precorrin-8X methylmutase [Marinifilaceae bacterium]